MINTRKKLIEVALPLDAINTACAREKSIRHGHPSTLHLWWARRPLASARAVIFSQMVDDPSAVPEEFPTPEAQEQERQRLFRIIEDLVLWENTTNEEVLNKARLEIRQSWKRVCNDNKNHPEAETLFNPEKLPAFHDPFAGGGAIPFEAQRLGLEAYASDLNPVAVLINKAMIDLPPKYSGCEPVNPEWQNQTSQEKLGKKWTGVEGLVRDVLFYGKWMRDAAEKKIGKFYPKVKISIEMVQERPDLKKYEDRELTVVAWLWARTVKSPNPAFRDIDVPLVSSYALSTKKGKEAFIQPVIEGSSYKFLVKLGKSSNPQIKQGTKAGGSGFLCLMSNTPIPFEYIRNEAQNGRMHTRLLAIVAKGEKGRVFLSPTPEHDIANRVVPDWKPDLEIVHGMSERVVGYGFRNYAELFTNRQLLTLSTFSTLIGSAIKKIDSDAETANLSIILKQRSKDVRSQTSYAHTVATYLAFALDKVADRGSSLGRWDPTPTQSGIINTFSRQGLPMTWDFAESNPLGRASGNFVSAIDLVAKALMASPAKIHGFAEQNDAQSQTISYQKVVSTDPPYFDNIGYADLSDFFYVWLRHSLRNIFPDLFSTLAVPKSAELIATSYRHGSKEKAELFFLSGMTKAMQRIAQQSHPAFPVTIYYAFKQSETKGDSGTASTGWETFLDAVILAGFAISGTWPMRTELSNRLIGTGRNALASSIIIVCKKQDSHAPVATRKEFRNILKTELPIAIKELQSSNIAPVDLAQASIGPGMEIFTRFSKILNAKGELLKVRDALVIINEILDEILTEQEGDFGPDTRWALAWYDQVGFKEGEFGLAETLSKAKNTSVDGLVEAGFLSSQRGKVRLLLSEELPVDWDPLLDKRLTEWEIVHHLIRLLAISEPDAASIVAKLGSVAEAARDLAYRLYSLAERKKRSQDALQYNMLVQSWPELNRLAEGIRKLTLKQSDLFEG